MAIFDNLSNSKLDEIIRLLKLKQYKSNSDDILIQYPNSAEEMTVPAGTSITPVVRRINKRMKFIAVSIPENGILTIKNNNIVKFLFTGESGTMEFPNGITIEDMEITLTNTDENPARFSYRIIFSE